MGHIPGVLTDKGISQAQDIAQKLNEKSISPTRIIASDLQRCIDTALIVHASFPNAKIDLDRNIRERYFGQLQGKNKAGIDFDDFWSQPKDSHPFGAESEDEFTRRIATFLLSITPIITSERIFIVTHSGVIHRILYLLDPESFSVSKHPNGELIPFGQDQLHEAALSYIHQATT